ncbi:MAG: hypothetical protein RL709_232 [Pseudomonadota bacterium]|jgi:hypothetical protein
MDRAFSPTNFIDETEELNITKLCNKVLHLDAIKTFRAKCLYTKAFQCWYKELKATQVNITGIENEIGYNINAFIKYKQRRFKMKSPNNDITFWLTQPYEVFKAYILELDIISEQLKNKKTIETVFESPYLKIITPLTWQACCKYGAGTKWCITNSTTTAYWDLYYSDKQKIFYFLPVDQALPKTILYTKTNYNHITDQEDNTITFQEFFTILKDNYKMSYKDIFKLYWTEYQFILFIVKRFFFKNKFI